MPWKASQATKHMAKAKGHEDQWASIANKVLSETGDEGKAIRIANAAVNRTIKARKRLNSALSKSGTRSHA